MIEKTEKEKKISQSNQAYLTKMKPILFPWGDNVWFNILEGYFSWCMLPIIAVPARAARENGPLVFP